jgi:hypothetical protein
MVLLLDFACDHVVEVEAAVVRAAAKALMSITRWNRKLEQRTSICSQLIDGP